jgi:putative membrane protein
MKGSVHVEVVAGVAALASAYLAAWRGAGGAVAPARVAAFGAGLAALTASLNGPLHDLAERLVFSGHMVQHVILTLVVPPLLLAGTPAFMIDALLRPGMALGVTRAVLRVLTRPLVAFAAWSVALVAWHLPGPYAAAVGSHGMHFLQHATLFVAAVLAWWPVGASSRELPPLPYAARLLYLFVFGMPMTIVAAMVTGAEHVLYPIAAPDALADQRLGGIVMWVPAGLVPLVSFTAVFFRWAAVEADEIDGHATLPGPESSTGVTD